MTLFYLILPLSLLLFVLITFGLSAVEKFSDWKGQISFLQDHFKNTFLSGMVPLLLTIISVVELAAAILAIYGIFTLITDGNFEPGFYALTAATLSLLMLMFGQRMAKDYVGSANLTAYFMVCIFGLYIFGGELASNILLV